MSKVKKAQLEYLVRHEQEIFSTVTEEELFPLTTAIEEFSIAEGKKLFSQNDISDGIYFILQGRAIVEAELFTGEKIKLVKRQAGDSVGELGLLDSSPRSASIIALTELRGYKLDHYFFSLLLKSYHIGAIKIVFNLYNILINKISDFFLTSLTNRSITEKYDIISPKLRKLSNREKFKVYKILPIFSDLTPKEESYIFKHSNYFLINKNQGFEYEDPDSPVVLILVEGALYLHPSKNDSFKILLAPNTILEKKYLHGYSSLYVARENAVILAIKKELFHLHNTNNIEISMKLIRGSAYSITKLFRDTGTHKLFKEAINRILQ